VDVHLAVIMWSVQVLCAHTSGEFGSGTWRGVVLRVKMSREALSSGRDDEVPLVAMEGAVLVMV